MERLGRGNDDDITFFLGLGLASYMSLNTNTTLEHHDSVKTTATTMLLRLLDYAVTDRLMLQEQAIRGRLAVGKWIIGRGGTIAGRQFA